MKEILNMSKLVRCPQASANLAVPIVTEFGYFVRKGRVLELTFSETKPNGDRTPCSRVGCSAQQHY